MRIAVLGSWKSEREKMLGSSQDFASACEDIGKELARHQQIVIVGSESSNAADAHVVRGMLSVISASRGSKAKIEVISGDEKANVKPYDQLYKQFPKNISYPPLNHGRWAVAHLMQIKDADAVLTIGGASGTYLTGLAAIVAKKLLVPIGSFGGASARLGLAMQSFGEYREESATLNSPWDSHVLDTASTLLGVSRRPRLLIIHGRSDDRYKLTEWLRTTLGIDDLLVMQQEFGGGQSLPEKFERLAGRVDGAIALATPDDTVTGVQPGDHVLRARQNVWLEVGWIWGRLGRHKVMLITKGKLDNPTDIQGLEYYNYASSPVETSESIRTFIAQLSASA